MTYEETMQKAKTSLSGWEFTKHHNFCRFVRHASIEFDFCAFDVNATEHLLKAEGRVVVQASGYMSVKFVENLFKDPFKATKEEAGLFKLEHGFNYPEELISDL